MEKAPISMVIFHSYVSHYQFVIAALEIGTPRCPLPVWRQGCGLKRQPKSNLSHGSFVFPNDRQVGFRFVSVFPLSETPCR